MFKEFREFATKGDVMDLAVGIMIGAAFTAIVNSFVKDMLTPVIALAGKANFENLFLVLKAGKLPGPYPTPEAAQKAGAVTLTYGNFLNAVVTFLLVAWVLFLIVRATNRFRRAAPAAPAPPPAPSEEVVLLTEIRDLLKTR